MVARDAVLLDPRAQQPLAPVAGLLGDALRGGVLDVGVELEPAVPALEAPRRDQLERARRDPPPALFAADPVADLRAAPLPHAQRDRAQKPIGLGVDDRERTDAGDRAFEVRLAVAARVRVRDRRYPASDLGVVDGRDERVEILHAPPAQRERPVLQLHRSILEWRPWPRKRSWTIAARGTTTTCSTRSRRVSSSWARR